MLVHLVGEYEKGCSRITVLLHLVRPRDL